MNRTHVKPIDLTPIIGPAQTAHRQPPLGPTANSHFRGVCAGGKHLDINDVLALTYGVGLYEDEFSILRQSKDFELVVYGHIQIYD